jgi:predicted esterase
VHRCNLSHSTWALACHLGTISSRCRFVQWLAYLFFTLRLQTIDQAFSGVAESRTIIDGFINAEIKAGIPADRIVIGGFSQVRPFAARGVDLTCAVLPGFRARP